MVISVGIQGHFFILRSDREDYKFKKIADYRIFNDAFSASEPRLSDSDPLMIKEGHRVNSGLSLTETIVRIVFRLLGSGNLQFQFYRGLSQLSTSGYRY